MTLRGRRDAAVIGLVALALVGCGPFVSEQDTQLLADEPAGVVGAGRLVGEDFTVHCETLSSVDVEAAKYPELPVSTGAMILTVATSTNPSVVVGTAEYPESGIGANDWLRIPIDGLVNSANREFVLTVRSTNPGEAPISLWATSHAAPSDTRRFVGANSVPGALVIRPSCDESPLAVAVDTVELIGREQWLWPTVLLLCLLPGLAISSLIERPELDPVSRLGSAVGWSVLAAPLALAVLTPIGQGESVGIVLLVLSAVGIVASRLKHRKDPLRYEWNWLAGAPGVALLATVGGLIVRAITARDLVAPMWVDSIQHSYIVSLILSNGGVPTTYGIAAPNQPFDYHFGFHTLAAGAAWIAGSSPSDAVLVTGQILSGLMPLVVYSLAQRLVGSPRAGAISALLVGIVLTQPTYLTSWGRYPEIAGLATLPAAYSIVCRAASRPVRRPTTILAALALAAAVLVHPRVAVFLSCLIAASVGIRAIPDLRATRDWRAVGRWAKYRFGTLAVVSVGALLLLSPWLNRLREAHASDLIRSMAWQPFDFPLGDAVAGPDKWVMIAAVIGVAIAIVRRNVGGWIALGWAALTLVAANPATFGIPLFPWVTNESVAISLFLPGSIFAGYAVASVGDIVGHARRPRLAAMLVAAATVGAALSQTPSLLTVINPCCDLINNGDLRAIEWVQNNTPANAIFVIDANEWAPNIWAGSDAGYWLWVLGPRQTTVPPLFYANGPPIERQKVNQLAAAVAMDGDSASSLAREARAAGASYVYVGTRGGPIDPGKLAASPEFRQVYGLDGAWVFEVVPTPTVDVMPTPTVDVTASATVTEITPVDRGSPSRTNAAGLKSTT